MWLKWYLEGKPPSLNSVTLAGTLSASPRFGALPKVACKSNCPGICSLSLKKKIIYIHTHSMHMASGLHDYYTGRCSCWFLWLPCWENVLHEDVSGKVQAPGELAPGWGSKTENRAASTTVSAIHTHSLSHTLVVWFMCAFFFFFTTPLLLLDLFLNCPAQCDQDCSIGDEWPRHPVIWTSLPATRDLQPGGVQCGVTHTNGPIRWLQRSRQALFCSLSLDLLCI